MADDGYRLEKCIAAITSMAASPAPLRDRIELAFPILDALEREESALPTRSREALAELRAKITSLPNAGDGRIRATLDAASDDELSELAALVVRVVVPVLFRLYP